MQLTRDAMDTCRQGQFFCSAAGQTTMRVAIALHFLLRNSVQKLHRVTHRGAAKLHLFRTSNEAFSIRRICADLPNRFRKPLFTALPAPKKGDSLAWRPYHNCCVIELVRHVCSAPGFSPFRTRRSVDLSPKNDTATNRRDVWIESVNRQVGTKQHRRGWKSAGHLRWQACLRSRSSAWPSSVPSRS
jgi:hypothetical protein